MINDEGEELTLPFQFSLPSFKKNIKVPSSKIAGGDGSKRAGLESKDNIKFIVSGSFNSNEDNIVAKKDEINKFLRYTPVKVYQLKGDNRYIEAYVTSVEENYVEYRGILNLRINFESIDPFFYGKLIASNVYYEGGYSFFLSSTETLALGPKFITPFMPAEEEVYKDVEYWLPDANRINVSAKNGGNVETYPVIVLTLQSSFTGSSSNNIKVRNTSTGSLIDIPGSYTSGEVIEIETNPRDDLKININGVNKLDIVNDSFLINGYFFKSGSNNLRVEWDRVIGSSADIRINLEYRERWL